MDRLVRARISVMVQSAAAKEKVAAEWKALKAVEQQLKAAQGRALDPAAADALALQHSRTRARLQNAQLELESLQQSASLYENAPYVTVWDSHADAGADSLAMLCRIDFPDRAPERAPAAGVDASPSGASRCDFNMATQ